MALAILAIAVALGTSGGAASRMAHAATDDTVVHHIINGSWYLHPGNTTNTPSYSGPLSDYMAQGTEFDVQCVTVGPPITPAGTLATDGSGDVAWEYGTDAATGDMGFVSDQGLDTQVAQGQEIAQLNAQGIPTCGAGNQQTANATPTTNFFSPIPGQANGLASLPSIADIQYDLNTWSAGDCTDTKVAQILQNLPTTVSTLAGWSLGRLGVLYFLQAATDQQMAQIHTIILFDPGDSHDFGGYVFANLLHFGNACDWKLNPNALLASWLQLNQQNRLIIFTGQVSEEKELAPGGNNTTVSSITSGTDLNSSPQLVSTYAGLWQYYFADVWNTTVGAQQVLVCDYDGLDHAAVLSDYYTSIQNPPSSCPSAPDQTHPLTSWHP
ncbi:MAG TPA: hypothetical protein VNG51_10210 [Ktedonobacteraceae bacterium]|nr:hypothetical protein [Ktedonobacteraceae bacterium]